MVFRHLTSTLLGLAALLASPVAGSAQIPLPEPAHEAGPATTGAVGSTGRIAAPGPRRGRGFRECNREAQGRRLRGMERRRFVYRCQVGSGRPLFRRRGAPTPPAAPQPTGGAPVAR